MPAAGRWGRGIAAALSLRFVFLAAGRAPMLASASTCTAERVAGCARRGLAADVTAVQGAGAEEEEEAETIARQSRIIGGMEVCPTFEYSHVVPLLKGQYMPMSNSFWHWFCGGTLYGRQHVITAAHCVLDEDGALDVTAVQGLGVEVHRHDLSAPLCTECAMRIAVASFATHPDFDGGTLENDIAVLRLAEPVPDSYDVAPVVLDVDGSFFSAGQPLVVAGWGATDTNSDNPQYSETLRAVEVNFIPTGQCTAPAWAYLPSEIKGTMLCAGFATGAPRDSCQGDSGGPLFVSCGEDDSVVLVGVASWGYGCAAARTPGVYTRVKDFAGWVDGVVAETNMGTNIELGVEVAALPEINEYAAKAGEEECCCDAEVDGCADLDCTSVDCSGWAGSCIDCSGNPCDDFTTWIGDGVCDDGLTYYSNFQCPEFALDGGDCDADYETCSDCVGGDCRGYLSWVGDGLCDDGSTYFFNFNCEDYNYDDGDCADTPACFDCQGNYCAAGTEFLGDSICDDGAFGYYFNCARFNYDEGDCPIPTTAQRSTTTAVAPATSTVVSTSTAGSTTTSTIATTASPPSPLTTNRTLTPTITTTTTATATTTTTTAAIAAIPTPTAGTTAGGGKQLPTETPGRTTGESPHTAVVPLSPSPSPPASTLQMLPSTAPEPGVVVSVIVELEQLFSATEVYVSVADTAREALLARLGMAAEDYDLRVAESEYGTVQIEVTFAATESLSEEDVRVAVVSAFLRAGGSDPDATQRPTSTETRTSSGNAVQATLPSGMTTAAAAAGAGGDGAPAGNTAAAAADLVVVGASVSVLVLVLLGIAVAVGVLVRNARKRKLMHAVAADAPLSRRHVGMRVAAHVTTMLTGHGSDGPGAEARLRPEDETI